VPFDVSVRVEAKDALALTPKNERLYGERRKFLEM
jgi:hypothetical protein